MSTKERTYNERITKLALAYEKWRRSNSNIELSIDEVDFIVSLYKVNVRRDVKSSWYEINPPRMKLMNELWKRLKPYRNEDVIIKWSKLTEIKTRILGWDYKIP